MLCIAVCVLNETCEIFWNSRANVKSDCALKRSVAAASSAVSEPDSLEISPFTFMPFDGTILLAAVRLREYYLDDVLMVA